LHDPRPAPGKGANLEITEELPIDPCCKKTFELGGHDYRSVGIGNPEEPVCSDRPQIGAHIRVNREPAVNRKALLYDSGVLLTGKRLSGGDSAKSDLKGRNRQDEQAPHVKRS
jgi:hypothetical protein